MKLTDLQKNLRMVPADLALHRIFYGATAAVVTLAIGTWLVWQNRGDHLLIPTSSLLIAGGLILLNLLLVFWALKREAFASYLLIGATLIGEVMITYFLYRV